VPRKYPYSTSADALLHPAKNAVFFEDWDAAADNLNHDLLCVEMSRLAYADAPAVTAALDRIGFSPVGFLGGESAEERIANRGTQGFVAKHAALGLTVLAFRGTESDKFEDLFSDLATVQTDFPGGGRIHSGFWKAYEPVRDRIANLLAQREGLLLITGHSLGAALATVAAAEVAPTKLITFGSPRVGDARFCERFPGLDGQPAIHRFVDCCDVVARVPPERFDGPHFSALFEELGNFEKLKPLARGAAWLAAKFTANALAGVFDAFGARIEFAHVAPPRYIRFDGAIVNDPDAALQAQDQAAARRAYPYSTEAQLKKLVTLLRSLAPPSTGRGAPRDFVRGVFELLQADPVPLRDLADHAPINYLSGIAGRADPAGPT